MADQLFDEAFHIHLMKQKYRSAKGADGRYYKARVTGGTPSYYGTEEPQCVILDQDAQYRSVWSLPITQTQSEYHRYVREKFIADQAMTHEQRMQKFAVLVKNAALVGR